MGPSTLDAGLDPAEGAPVHLDRNGLEVLSRTECLRLLGRSAVGRVVLTEQALPAAHPVHYAMLGDDVVFLPPPGSKLDSAMEEEVVAFEVDDFETSGHAGWRVLVQGWAGVVTDPELLARARALGLRPWASSCRLRYVRIRMEFISGRRRPVCSATTAIRADDLSCVPEG